MAENQNCKGNKFCLNHLKENVNFLCEDCKQKICNTCVSTTHKGHNLIDIKLLAQQKYSKLQDLNTDIHKNKIPRVRSKLQAAEQSVKKIKQGINSNITAAETQGEHLKGLIDKFTVETVSELEAIKTKITKQLDQFRADSENVIKRLEELMKESTEATKSDDNILIVDVEEQFSSLKIKEPEFVCDYPVKFIQGPDPETNIETALGTIVYVPPPHVISKMMDLSILPQTIQQPHQDTLYISEFRGNKLAIIDKDRSTKILTLDTPLYDICLDPVSGQLYCAPDCHTGPSIRTVDTTSGKTTELFTTKTASFCLNVTNNSETLIVGTHDQSEVTLYDKGGTILQTVTTVAPPTHIAVCRSTGKVALACWNSGVMVMENQSGRSLQHMYNFPTDGTTSNASNAEFDNTGHLLVTDFFGKKVYIADVATGNTLKVIAVKDDDGNPEYVTTQKNGDLVLCTQYPNKLLTIKYLG